MKENDHMENVKFMHNVFSNHNAFYVFMDRFHGKPNSQFLSSSEKKVPDELISVRHGSPTQFFSVSFLLTCLWIFVRFFV